MLISCSCHDLHTCTFFYIYHHTCIRMLANVRLFVPSNSAKKLHKTTFAGILVVNLHSFACMRLISLCIQQCTKSLAITTFSATFWNIVFHCFWWSPVHYYANTRWSNPIPNVMESTTIQKGLEGSQKDCTIDSFLVVSAHRSTFQPHHSETGQDSPEDRLS